LRLWHALPVDSLAPLRYNASIVTLTIPDERFGNLKLDERDLMTDIAIGLYKREQVSLGRAAEIAGVSSPQFLSELGRRRIPINYDVDDLRADTKQKNLLSSVSAMIEVLGKKGGLYLSDAVKAEAMRIAGE